VLSTTRYTRRTTRVVRPHRSSRLQRECSPAPTEGEEPPAAAIDSVCTSLPPLSLDIHPSPSPHCSNTGDVSATQAVRAERPWFLRAVLQCVHRRVAVTCGRGCRRRARRPTPARAASPRTTPTLLWCARLCTTVYYAPCTVGVGARVVEPMRVERDPAAASSSVSTRWNLPPTVDCVWGACERWVGSGAQPHSPFSPPNPVAFSPSMGLVLCWWSVWRPRRSLGCGSLQCSAKPRAPTTPNPDPTP
jgi:hypothetical protein